MDRIKAILRGEPKVQKRFIRDSKGRPYYLSQLTHWRKHQYKWLLSLGLFSVVITYSGFIYNLLFIDHAKTDPSAYLWRSERESGITNLERFNRQYRKSQGIKEVEEDSRSQ